MKPTKKKVARKPKLEPWRAELARIVKFLNANDGPAKQLWWVLSALRGPDFTETFPYKTKKAITGVLRHQIGLIPLSIAFVNELDCKEYSDDRQQQRHNDDHFYYHAKEAFNVLGLKWGEVNK